MDHGTMVQCGPVWTVVPWGPWTMDHGPWFHDWVLPRRISCLTGTYYVIVWSMVVIKKKSMTIIKISFFEPKVTANFHTLKEQGPWTMDHGTMDHGPWDHGPRTMGPCCLSVFSLVRGYDRKFPVM